MKENGEFIHNIRGISHLTSPLNYVNNEEIKGIVNGNKAFLLNSIDTYKAKINKSKTNFPSSPDTRPRKLSPKELKIQTLRDTFSKNIAGSSVNGRSLKLPEFKFNNSTTNT